MNEYHHGDGGGGGGHTVRTFGVELDINKSDTELADLLLAGLEDIGVVVEVVGDNDEE